MQQPEPTGGRRQSDNEHDARLGELTHRPVAADLPEGQPPVRPGVGNGGHEQRDEVGRQRRRSDLPEHRVGKDVCQGRTQPDRRERPELTAHSAGQPGRTHLRWQIHADPPRDDPTGDPDHSANVLHRRRHDIDPGVRVVRPVDRNLMNTETVTFGEQQQLGVEEPVVVLDRGQEGTGHVGPDRLEATLGVPEGRPEGDPQHPVVTTGDDLPFRSTNDPGPANQPRTDRDVRMARKQRRDQRQQCLKPAGEIHVHICDDIGVRRRPDGPQRPAAALGLQPCHPDPTQVGGQLPGDRGRGVGTRVVCDRDTPVKGKTAGQEVMQSPDAVGKGRLLVVDRDHHLDDRLRSPLSW